MDHSESFNFTFEMGVGVEYFLRPKKSVRFDDRVQHLRNAYLALSIPVSMPICLR